MSSVYSMMPLVQKISFLYKMETGKMEWGISGREGEREQEKQIKRVGGRV